MLNRIRHFWKSPYNWIQLVEVIIHLVNKNVRAQNVKYAP